MTRHFSPARYAQRLLFGAGTLLLAYVAGTVGYAEFQQRKEARNLEREIAALGISTVTVPGLPSLSEGVVIGKLEIPRIGMSVMTFQGVQDDTLRLGAGHVPGTALPGERGNASIAAHRDTFFRGLKGIRSGDRIQFSSLRGTYDYVVDSTEIVDPDDTQVMDNRGHTELTLITCYPFYFIGSAPHRFIVHARFVDPLS